MPYHDTVTLTVTYSNGTTCTRTKDIEVKDCAVTISTPVKDDTYTGSGTRYIISANATHCNNEQIVNYTWRFAGGVTKVTQVPRVEHVFQYSGTTAIHISVSFGDGCIAEHSFYPVVSAPGCCKALDNDKDEKNITLANSYYLNHYFSVRNVWPFHRIVVKNIHKKTGKVVRQKAHSMTASFRGSVVYKSERWNDEGKKTTWWDCNAQTSINPRGISSSNKCQLIYDYGVGRPFRVGNKELHSKFSVKTTSSSTKVEDNDKLQLHNKNCN